MGALTALEPNPMAHDNRLLTRHDKIKNTPQAANQLPIAKFGKRFFPRDCCTRGSTRTGSYQAKVTPIRRIGDDKGVWNPFGPEPVPDTGGAR
jgi:hypothetical protein